MIRFTDLFRRRCEKPQPDPFLELIEKAYYKGARDIIITIAYEIIKKSIKPGEDIANVYMKLYETDWNLEKYSKMIECIASDGTNEHRFRCIMNVLGLQITKYGCDWYEC
jgi:hypothetical protein